MASAANTPDTSRAAVFRIWSMAAWRVVFLVSALLLVIPPPANGQTGEVRYVYDEVGRLVAVIDPFGEAAIYDYDAVGNLLSITRSASSIAVKIVYFSPQTAPIGATVTISGTGFSAVPTENAVTFNGTAATVTSATATQLVTSVPVSPTSGVIAVTTPAGSAVSVEPFTVVASSAPTISGFSPTIGVVGNDHGIRRRFEERAKAI